jgi:protein-tyrosine kinase
MSRITRALERAGHVSAGNHSADDATLPWEFAEAVALVAPPADHDVRPVGRRPQPAPSTLMPVQADAAPLPMAVGAAVQPCAVATLPELSFAVREEFRQLAAILHHAQREEGVRVLMVASALAGEGKTLVACQIAQTLSGSFGRRVLLLDCDLRKPSLHTRFGLPEGKGIGECLTAAADVTVPPTQISPTLWLLPGGRPQSDPMRIVTSSGMGRLVREAAATFDWVILDSPPVALLADANLLAAMTDKVLFVIEAERTPYDVIQASLDAIGRERVIGAVLNHAESTEVTANSEYAGYDPDTISRR